ARRSHFADGTAIALDPKPGPGSRTVPAGRQPRFAGGPVLGQTLRPAGGIWGVVACFGPLAGWCDARAESRPMKHGHGIERRPTPRRAVRKTPSLSLSQAVPRPGQAEKN